MGVTEGDNGDGCDLAWTWCKYDLKTSDNCSWARVRRVMQESIFRAAYVW